MWIKCVLFKTTRNVHNVHHLLNKTEIDDMMSVLDIKNLLYGFNYG